MPLSPDGHWAWNGQQWIPAQPPAAHGAPPPIYPAIPSFGAGRPIGPAPGVEYAPWLSRAFAAVVDGAIFVIAILVCIGLITSNSNGTPGDGRNGVVAVGALGLVLTVILGCVYQVVLPAHGGTWGMRALHLRVARADTGANIGLPLALGRWAVFLLLNAIPFGTAADLLWPLWDERRQTLHDKAVNTLVVRPITDAPGV